MHEIKFDGYRMQMRIEDGEVSLKTRKALDWTEKFSAIAKAAAKLPDAIIDGEIVALNEKGDPDFSRLQAALSDGDTDDLIYFAFDLLFADGEDLRTLPLVERKDRLRALLGKHARRKELAASLCRAFRRRRRRGDGIGAQRRPRRHHLEAGQRPLSLRPQRRLAQESNPAPAMRW